MRETMRAHAKPAKLRDGTWGAKTEAGVQVGETITVTAHSGKAWDAKVTEVVWSDERGENCLVRLEQRKSSKRSRAPARELSGAADSAASDELPAHVQAWLDGER